MNVWLFILLISVFNSAFASLPNLKSLIANKHYFKAIELGQQLKQSNPQSASVLFYTALAYQNTKQPNRAKKLYLSAISQNAHLPEVYNNLAAIYVAEENYIKAAETLTLAINSQPNIATAYRNLSTIYRHLASEAYQHVLNKGDAKKLKTPKLNSQILASLDFKETIKILKPKPVIETPITPVFIPETKQALPSAKLAIINWAKAWKNKQYNAYITSYSHTYAPKNLNHSQWLSQRQKRIQRPGAISVVVSNFNVTLQNNKAFVNFDQAYRSKTYQDKVRKRMHLTLINGRWLITSEVTLSVL